MICLEKKKIVLFFFITLPDTVGYFPLNRRNRQIIFCVKKKKIVLVFINYTHALTNLRVYSHHTRGAQFEKFTTYVIFFYIYIYLSR